MGKRKDKKNWFDLMGKLTDLMQGMSDEELTLLGEMMNDGGLLDQSINNNFYRYQRPDYAKNALKEMRWLGPFWNARHDDDKIELCKFVDNDWKHLSPEEKQAEVRGYMNLLFSRFSPNSHDNFFKLFGPLWMMEQYKMTECLDLVLETLRQDAYFFTRYFMGREDCLTALIYQIGNGQIDTLEQFLYEQGIIPNGKPIVFKAIVMTWIKQPHSRLKTLSILSKYLKHCLEICRKGASPANIEQYAFTLATAHVTELMPLIRTLYKELDIPQIETDGIRDIEETMNDPFAPFNCEHDNVTAYVWELAQEEMYNYGKDYEDEEAWDDYEEENDYYNLDETCKRYILRLELMDGPETVERTIQVPSNMYIETLAEVIMMAFGRSDVPDDYRYATKDTQYSPYLDDIELDEDMSGIESSFEVTIATILPKKGNIAYFNLLDKNGNIKWKHAIILEKSGKYTEKTTHYIELIDGRSAYPSKNTKDMDDFLKRHKEGKVREPDFKSIRKKIEKFETETGAPC